MAEPIKVYLDDVRPTPTGWVRTYTVDETIELLNNGNVSDLSLDNDLGENQPEGWNVLNWIEEQLFNGTMNYVPRIMIHSMNPAAAQKMRAAIVSINRIAAEMKPAEPIFRKVQKYQFTAKEFQTEHDILNAVFDEGFFDACGTIVHVCFERTETNASLTGKVTIFHIPGE